ncbi:uncharacterized protein LOC110457290 [Mizuhopecten yessoensis]|uniref:uncharacterized protein LOC110457290 n=1 Tax=Mizuhopecten yessoensis TaxID=6573 RepID=UPI000B4580EF|nr:uncharacterized protein LOC110457290 [Mizuhopecten yessoensis]
MKAKKMATGERFASVTNANFQKLLADKDSVNTKKATEHAVRVFLAYLKEKSLDTGFEYYDTDLLDSTLAKFYTEARSSKGKLYKKSTLTSIRHGLNRHLSEFDIINGVEFSKSKRAFQAMLVELKRQGLGGIEHHPPIDKVDLEKLYSSFILNDHESLQCKVFVDIMLHFGRRGRENIRDLKKSDFATTTDAEGWRYIYLTKDELTKNHQADTNTAQGRMYEIKDESRCPVKSLVMYVKILPPGYPYLFPKVRRTPNQAGYFFDNTPMGHNKLGALMTTLSTKYRLSRKYTNHSLRATAVHLLDSAQVPSRHIMTVTGHKSEQSLKTYTGYTDVNTKRYMSHTISRGIGLSLDEPMAELKKYASDVAETQIPSTKSDVINHLGNCLVQPPPNSQVNTLLDEFDNGESNEIAVSAVLDAEMSEVKPCVSGLPNQSNVTNHVPNVLGYSEFCIPNFQWPIISGQNAQVTINYNSFPAI